MNKIFISAALLICGMIKLISTKKIGYTHDCSKGSDCADLDPKAYGCMFTEDNESQCFYLKKSNLKKKSKIEFYFNK